MTLFIAIECVNVWMLSIQLFNDSVALFFFFYLLHYYCYCIGQRNTLHFYLERDRILLPIKAFQCYVALPFFFFNSCDQLFTRPYLDGSHTLPPCALNSSPKCITNYNLTNKSNTKSNTATLTSLWITSVIETTTTQTQGDIQICFYTSVWQANPCSLFTVFTLQWNLEIWA